MKEEKQKAAEKERKRKEQEAEMQRKKKLHQEEQQLVKERKRKAENTSTTTTTTANTLNVASLPKKDIHHVLTDDSNTIIMPIGQRRTSVAGPIGSPVKSRSVQQQQLYIANDSDNHHSFFSNFLFGQPINNAQQQQQAESFFTHKKANRRVSVDSANLKWSNGK